MPNVGIGTTSPTTALDVSGAFTARGMSSAPSVSASNTGRIYFDYGTNKFKVSQNGGAYVDLVGGSGATSISGLSDAKYTSYNLFFGNLVGSSLTSGDYNTGVGGIYTARNITSGSSNTAFGASALWANQTGSANVAIGKSALEGGNAVNNNVAVGNASMMSAGNSASYNVGVGANSLMNISGWGNVGIGNSSGSALTTGNYNVILGSNTGSGISTSSNNVIISDGQGNVRMQIDSSGNVGIGVTGPTSKLQVAGDITPDTTATKNLGSSSLRWNNIYLSNAPDVSSDARLKKDVQTSDLGLDFVNSLRPVSWTWKDQSQGTTQHYGVIAQEAESAIAKAKGQDSNNVIVTHNEETDSYSVRYTELISPLIKAIQELYAKVMGHDEKIQAHDRQFANVEASKADKTEVDAKVQKLESENNKLKQENAAMKARLDKIEKMLKSK